MLVFLNQGERRQFLIISVSERDWKREPKLEFKMASNRCKLIFRRFDLPFAALRGLCERKYQWGARRISCKTSRGISTHFAGDVWSSYRVGPGLLQQNQLTQDLERLIQIMNSRLQSLVTLNSDFHYEGNTEESSTTLNSQWSNWKNASHNIVQVSNQKETLCCWPSGIPNSFPRRLSVLGDIPSILAISTQRNPNASLSPWICSCLISYLGLLAIPDLSRVNNCEFCVVLDLFCSALIMKVTV